MADSASEATGTVAIREQGLLAQFAQMSGMIPLEATDGAAERILAQILQAQSWDELDAPWESSKAEQLLGRRLILQYAERRPSDFREGLGIFLVLHCTDPKTGEVVVATTSSISVLGQVARAYALDALPLLVEFVVAERPTERGYKPHHLKVWGSAKASQASAEQAKSA